MWVSHLGCIKGCLEYLNMDVSDAWLFGATGHAFILNVHEVVCPSGPTAWKTEMLFKLGENIGYTVDGVFGTKSDADFAEKQKLAWEKTKQAIDEGLPCYGWELDIPEYYVVNGYDERGYHYRDFNNSGRGPKQWKELGDTEIGVLEMYIVKPGNPADDVQTVKEAFGFVLEHSKSPAKWIFPKYKSGLAGFDNWIHALENGKADGFGVAHNAVVWSECRNSAVEFLKEAEERLASELKPLFSEALGHYKVVAQNLKHISEIFPFKGPETRGDEIRDSARCNAALEYLRNARNAEESGLLSLEKILRHLNGMVQ